MGASLTVEAGYRAEWNSDAISRPFEAFASDINRIRAGAKHRSDTVLNLLAKEVGNSGYGKIAQAVSTFRPIRDTGLDGPVGKRVFNSREDKMMALPPSRITSPMHAAMITSLVRAALSEALCRLPMTEVVFSATTDGFLTTLPLQDVDTTGPIARAFSGARMRLTGDPALWEPKHVVAGVVVVKTRCTYSRGPVDPNAAGEPVLARGGYRFGSPFTSEWDESRRWIELHRDRDYSTSITSQSLIPLRTQWIEDKDLTPQERTARVNLDFDWKRRVVDPNDVDGVMTGDTAPWETIEQFHAERDGLEKWKRDTQRVEKSVADLAARRQWLPAQAGLRASGSTGQSGRPALLIAVLRAIPRGELNRHRGPTSTGSAYSLGSAIR